MCALPDGQGRGGASRLKRAALRSGRGRLVVVYVIASTSLYLATMCADQKSEELDWNLESAEIAYSVIARYVEHTQISGILIALLASALGEERLKPIAQNEYWQSYLASKRSITDARQDIERLTALIERMRQESATK
jgi:hypothetical protein